MILILGRENNFYEDVAVSAVKYNDSTSARETQLFSVALETLSSGSLD